MSDHLRDPLAGCRAYLHAHHHLGVRKDKKQLPFVTISREAGAGGVTIAEWTAQILNQALTEQSGPPWTVFDKNIVRKVMEDHQLPASLEQFLPEDVAPGVTSAVEEMLGLHPSAWTLAEKTTATILRLARLGNVILVGRGSACITANLHPAVHVRLVAPFEVRTAHLAEYHHLTLLEAERYAAKADQGRGRYVKRFLGSAIDDPLNYTLTINTGRLNWEATAHLIAEAVKRTAG